MSIEDLLRSDPSTAKVILHSSFIESITNLPNFPSLIDFFCIESRLIESIDFMFGNFSEDSLSQAEKIRLAYNSSFVFRLANDQITKKFTYSKSVQQTFFKMCEIDSDDHATALGYFEDVYRTLLSSINDDSSFFAKLISCGYVVKVFPMVISMNDAHRSILKTIFESKLPDLAKLKSHTFDYMMYNYLNEKIPIVPEGNWRNKYRNVRMLLNCLACSEDRFLFKSKYVSELFALKHVKHENVPGFLEELFHLKISILKFLAKTGQVKTAPRLFDLFESWRSFSGSKQRLLMLQDIVDFVKAMSANDEFKRSATREMIGQLLKIFDETPFCDILHKRVIEILIQLMDVIGKDPDIRRDFSTFLSEKLEAFRSRNANEEISRPVSKFHFVSLLEKFELKAEETALIDLKQSFESLYRDSEKEAEQEPIVVSEKIGIEGNDLDGGLQSDRACLERLIGQKEEVFLNNPENFSIFQPELETLIHNLDPYSLDTDLDRTPSIKSDKMSRGTSIELGFDPQI